MKNKYYCGKCEHIGMYTGSYTHSEKLCKRYAEILKVDGNDVEKCVPCICETLEAENAELKTRLEKAAVPPCKIGDVLYTVTITFSDGWVGDTIIRRSAISLSETVVTEKNIWRMCELIRIGKAFFSKEAAEARLKDLQGGKQ